MSNHSSEKLKFVFGLLVCLFLVFAYRFLTLNDTATIETPDKAVFEYRSNFEKTGRHDLKRLRDVLYQQFHHPDIRVRMNIAEVLGEFPGPDILPDLWKIYLNESDAAVRNSAVAGMLNHGGPAILKFLLQSMSDPDPDIRRESIQGCSVFADASLRGILEKKYAEEFDPLNRLALAAVLYKAGDTAMVGYLKDALLHNRDPRIRAYVAHLLQDSGIQIDTPIIQESIAQENIPEVKVWLGALLAVQGDAAALAYLKDTVSGHQNPDIRSSAAQALNALGEQAYVYPFLLELLETGDEDIRERAIEDLVDFHGYPLLPVLDHVLRNDPSITVREIAAWAMGERKEIAALPYLERGLYDQSAFVRTGVVAALYKILQNSAPLPLDTR